MGGPGAVAGIHRAQLKKAKEQLARIEEQLDLARIGEGETTADRVETLATEVIALRRRVDDLEFEAAG